MEVYILDSLNRRTSVIDNFVSLIWTERFNLAGDFEMKVHSNLANRNSLLCDVRLAMNESYRVMIIETVEDDIDADGNQILTIKGPSLEYIFKHRLAMSSLSGTTANPKWILEGYPKAIANQLFHDICVTGVVNAGDIISYITEENIFSIDTLPDPNVLIAYEVVPPATLYDALTKICQVYDMGFRLVREPETNALYFDVYMGSDRSTQQTTLMSIVFSESLENLSNTRELTTKASYKNVAYVLSPVGCEIVLGENVDPSVTGFDRRVLVVKADDITDEVPADATAKMIQRGTEELAKNHQLSAFDGELSKDSFYIYGYNYNLGDLVEVHNADDACSNMRITEQIFVSDREGERSYPTLSVNSFVTPGSWLSWDYSKVWADFLDTEYWADQP